MAGRNRNPADWIARYGQWRAVYAPADPEDTQPWCVVDRLDQIVRRFKRRDSARAYAHKLADDDARLDSALYPFKSRKEVTSNEF